MLRLGYPPISQLPVWLRHFDKLAGRNESTAGTHFQHRLLLYQD